MELKILNEEKQSALSRTTITARVFADAESPSRQQVVDALAEDLGADRSLVIVHKILPAFGDKSSTVHARVYTNADVMNELERANLIEKNKKVEETPEKEDSE